MLLPHLSRFLYRVCFVIPPVPLYHMTPPFLLFRFDPLPPLPSVRRAHGSVYVYELCINTIGSAPAH